jgi:hypothetical protein
MTISGDPTSAFDRFLAAFPQRDGGHDLDAVHLVWRPALMRAPASTIILGAVAYAAAVKDRPPRFVMSARRWLQESRWRDVRPSATPSKPALVWISLDSPEWQAWAAFYLSTKGKTPLLDARGGWRFPARFPPSIAAAE